MKTVAMIAIIILLLACVFIEVILKNRDRRDFKKFFDLDYPETPEEVAEISGKVQISLIDAAGGENRKYYERMFELANSAGIDVSSFDKKLTGRYA